ncbi:hypothetical protein MMC19_003051 [Ptychographa xylographoides]|nr:hypothetical protein [Ptychographa xylographoides]
MSITALSLPSIRTAHWVAQGFFVVTLSYGVLSVRSSIEVQARLSSWSNVKEIRSRLSFRRVDEAKGIDCTGGAIDPALDIAEPGQYTRMAALSFYLGLGVYLGTVWTSGGNNVPGPNDSRNIFLCFISVIASEIVKWVFLSLLTLEDYEKQQEEEESTETVPEGSKKAEQPLHPA